MSFSRRSFLRGASGALGLYGLQRFSLLEGAASAASSTGYRALVGVLLAGGNDANNLVIPTSTAGYAKYAAVRGTAANVGIPQASLLALNAQAGAAETFGLHPSFPKLQALYNSNKKLALVFNVGTLVAPTTIAAYRAGTATLPEHLFSHSDQQDAWSTAIPDPLASGGARSGWAGRTADKIIGQNTPSLFPVVTRYQGRPLFGVGNVQQQLTINSTGTLALSSTGVAAVNSARDLAFSEMALVQTGAAPADAFTAGFNTALANATKRASARSGNKLPAAVSALFPNTTLGQELLHVAEDILAGASAAANGLGLKRQIFSAALGGFDTHTGQISTQASLYTQMDNALSAFYDAIAALNAMIATSTLPGVTQPLQVTLFTMSDFGRTFKPNSGGGSDHGWGNHMLVLGDQVLGGATYGTFPDLTLGATGLNDVGEGRWLPSTSADQYGYTLASWLGLAAADRNYVFPKLPAFATDKLTFLG